MLTRFSQTLSGRSPSPVIEFPTSSAIQRLSNRAAPNLEVAAQRAARAIGRRTRWILRFLALLVLAAMVLLMFFVHFGPKNEPLMAVIVPVAFIPIYLVEFFLLWLTERRLGAHFALRRAYRLLGLVDSNPKDWGKPEFMAEVIERIQTVARGLELVDGNFGIHHPSIRNRLRAAMLGRAERFRVLCVWVFSPMSTTREDLLSILEKSVEAMMESRWLELDGEDVETVRAKWGTRIVQGGIAVVSVAGLLAAQIYATTIGSAATVIATLAGIALVAALSKMGISTAEIASGSKMMGDASSSSTSK